MVISPHRSPTFGVLAAASLLAALGIVLSASPVLACTSEAPTRPLARLVAEARYIVEAIRVDEADDGALLIAWRRVLKTRDAPDPIAVPAQDTACPYPWGLPADDQRAVMLIADGPSGLVVTDVWLSDDQGYLLTPIHHAEVATHPSTVDSLLRYLDAGFPDTATADSTTPVAPGGPSIAILAALRGAIAGAWVLLSPRRPIAA